MEMLLGVFSAFGLSASAGLNAYIPLFVIGVIAHYFPDTLTLSQPLDTLANPWILILLGVLVIIEMVADKVPAVNHHQRSHSNHRPPCGGSDCLRRQRTGHHRYSSCACIGMRRAHGRRCACGQGGGSASCGNSNHGRRGKRPCLDRRRYRRIRHICIRDPDSHYHGNHTDRSSFNGTLVALATHRQSTNCLI